MDEDEREEAQVDADMASTLLATVKMPEVRDWQLHDAFNKAINFTLILK